MGPKHLFILYHLTVLVNGDWLLDYAEEKLEGLPNWVVENVEDGLSLTTENYSGSNRGIMSYSLKPFNLTLSGLKSIRLYEKPGISGSLFSGILSISVTITMDLMLSGNYEISGTLFPFVEQIPYTSSGMWSANTSLQMSQTRRILMDISMNGSMMSDFDQSYTSSWAAISEFYFDTFLEDNINQWYYPIVKEGFENLLRTHTHLDLHEKIQVLERFFEETFRVINYSDIDGI